MEGVCTIVVVCSGRNERGYYLMWPISLVVSRKWNPVWRTFESMVKFSAVLEVELLFSFF